MRWIYLSEPDDDVRGPVALAELVGLIRKGRLSVFTIVAPTPQFRDNGVCAYMWPQVLKGLSSDLAVLRRAWLRWVEKGAEGETGFWAVVVAEELVATMPARAWKLICALAKASNRQTLDFLGVGLLEEMVAQQPAYHPKIIAKARRETRFRLCLSRVGGRHLTEEMRKLTFGRPSAQDCGQAK